MNRFPYSAAVASVIATLLLGFMVKIVNDDPAWLPFDSGDTPVKPAAEPSASVAVYSPALNCKETENALRDRIDTARYCATDSDCTLFDFGYPIDCMTSVAKSEITALRLDYRRYEQSCDYRVYFDCPAEPMERRAVCEENRCIISLQAIDTLEEETLVHLGIGQSAQSR